ncbi:MAG: SufD family Fe-S cluster assembly protein [Chlamydiae bacterium]|nr:SufD family Fe-S cluster assembly protein [Chlamydiota bacterium]
MKKSDLKAKDFLLHLLSLVQERVNGDKFAHLKTAAWESFLTLSPENDSFFDKLSNVEYQVLEKMDCSKEEILSYVSLECKKSFFVFVNGHLNLEISNIEDIKDQIEILDFEKGLRLSTLFFKKNPCVNTNSFAQLNLAFQKDGLYLKILKNSKKTSKVQILHFLNQDSAKTIISPKIQIFFNKKTKLSLLFSTNVKKMENLWFNQVVDLFLEDGAKVSLLQNLSDVKDGFFFDNLRAYLNKDSFLKIVSIANNVDVLRKERKIDLLKENSAVEIYDLFVTKDKNNNFSKNIIEHSAKKSLSKQLTKTVLNDSSKFSLECEAVIKPLAIQSNSSQLAKNLFLSKEASAISKPHMKVFVDDVSATHGFSSGDVNQDELFYLMTRGVDRETAQKLLIVGFCKEILDNIDDFWIKKEIEGSMQKQQVKCQN